MLIELGRQFDEIADDAGAGNARIGDVGEEPVEPVAEFVEHGARFIEREERGLAFGGL